MSRYQALADFLASKKSSEWSASFAEIEAMLGFRLPASAYNYPAWWANQTGGGHSQVKGWRAAGWRTRDLDLKARRVRFERDVAAPAAAAGPEGSGAAELMERAMQLSGISDTNALVSEALRALIAREAAARLARLGGTMPAYEAPARERPRA